MAFYKGTHVLLVSTDSDKNWQVSSCWCVDEYPQKPSQGSRILQVRWLPELLNFYFVVPLLQKYKLSKSRSHLTSKMRDGTALILLNFLTTHQQELTCQFLLQSLDPSKHVCPI
jgi:hypothetical protein